MSAHDDELPAAARRILGEYRNERRMPPGAFDRVQRRLLRPAGSWGIAVVAAATAAALTVFALTTLSRTRATENATGEHPQAQDDAFRDPTHGELVTPEVVGESGDTAAAEIPAAPPSIANPIATPTTVVRTAADPPRSSTHTPAPKPPTPTPPVSTLAAEQVLLSQAQQALADGANDRVAAIVRQHTKDFPKGALRPEFAAVQAMLRCRDAGQSRDAVLAAFTTAHADSPLIAAVRQVCAPS